MGNYVVKTDIGIWPAAYDDDAQDAVINQIEEYVENLTHRIFYKKLAEEMWLDGRGATMLMGFPYPLLSITSVTIEATLLASGEYRNDEDSISLRPLDETTPTSGPYSYTTFPEGYRNIKVIADVGMEATPASIKRAVIILIEHGIDPTLHADTGFTSEKVSDLSHGAPERGKPGSLTGVIEADKLLLPYVKKRLGLGVV